MGFTAFAAWPARLALATHGCVQCGRPPPDRLAGKLLCASFPQKLPQAAIQASLPAKEFDHHVLVHKRHPRHLAQPQLLAVPAPQRGSVPQPSHHITMQCTAHAEHLWQQPVTAPCSNLCQAVFAAPLQAAVQPGSLPRLHEVRLGTTKLTGAMNTKNRHSFTLLTHFTGSLEGAAPSPNKDSCLSLQQGQAQRAAHCSIFVARSSAPSLADATHGSQSAPLAQATSQAAHLITLPTDPVALKLHTVSRGVTRPALCGEAAAAG